MVNGYKLNIFSSKKGLNSDTWYNMDEPWKHDAKWNKPDTEGQILHGYNEVPRIWGTLCEAPRMGKFWDKK